jgi:hypothetical protein
MREQHVNPLVSAQAADLPATVGHLAQRHTNPTNHTRNKISDRAAELTRPRGVTGSQRDPLWRGCKCARRWPNRAIAGPRWAARPLEQRDGGSVQDPDWVCRQDGHRRVMPDAWNSREPKNVRSRQYLCLTAATDASEACAVAG